MQGSHGPSRLSVVLPDIGTEKDNEKTVLPDRRTPILGIYELNGDVLKVCTDLANKDRRPSDFISSVGSSLILRVYRRQGP